MNLDVIFDNGGGITIQTENYVAYYQDEKQAAMDALKIAQGEDPVLEGWDGNDPEMRLEYDHETERTGGCRWVGLGAVLTGTLPLDCIGWRNADGFFCAIREENQAQ